MEQNNITPIIGMVLKSGELYSYNGEIAKENNYHHSFIVTSKAISSEDYDDALRFVKLEGESFYTLEGEPALRPYGKGKKQISLFAKHCLDRGVDGNTKVKIKDHKLNTYYEGQFIGRLMDFAAKEL